MLLILSDDYDFTTNHVVDWLYHKNIPHVRVNGASILELEKLELTEGGLSWELVVTEKYNDTRTRIRSEEITGFWYRRGNFNFQNHLSVKEKLHKNNLDLIGQLRNYQTREYNDISSYLNDWQKGIKHLGSFTDNFKTKIANLNSAKKNQLKIPATAIISNKKTLLNFFKKYSKIITKGIYTNSFGNNSTSFSSPTQIITDETINSLPNLFAASLVQEYIEKIIEIRVFYINDSIFAAAIFSQQNHKTKVDYRNYDDEKPNRLVPFTLPTEIESKLINFMRDTGMNCGSIDLILSSDLEYVFLEVNPVGQFGWISVDCNYQFEKMIATYFAN